ncbi:MAG: hypothetical protein Q8S00_19525 [Deltaproteobacteria bacterium]|nr:hypothetical protein [Deltaproteobacteria bacterium]MDZ4345396.1 hypothetical protein [Candidatus Binatia bacterium]
MKFSLTTTKRLGHYVYALVDPRDKTIFYIGKASANNRAFNHLRIHEGEERKHQRIQEIRAAGGEPSVEILRYGLGSVRESFEVEAALIDALGLENLTNKVRGHGVDRGRQTAGEVERLHGSKPAPVERIRDPYILFFINQTYSPTKTEFELYDCVRQFWSGLSPKRRTPSEQTGAFPYPTALAIVESVVVRAYSIVAWFPAGTTLSTRRAEDTSNCWEFVGNLIADHPLVGRRLTKDGKDLPANQLGYGYLN